MTIGVRAHDFGSASAPVLAATIRENGFAAVQLALHKAIAGIALGETAPPRRLEEIRLAFEMQNVQISVLGCYIEPALPDRTERLRQVALFEQGLRHAKALGGMPVGTETTRFDPAPENAPHRETAYQCLKDSVLRMAEAAERVGVDMALEPVADHTLHSVELTQRLLEEVDSRRIRILFDPVNLLLEDTWRRQAEIYRQFLRVLGGRLAAVHLKDIVFENGRKQWRNIGEGLVDYADIFAWLREHAPDIPILREHARPDSCRRDIAAMRRLAGQ